VPVIENIHNMANGVCISITILFVLTTN
jgi:hypothetical protein